MLIDYDASSVYISYVTTFDQSSYSIETLAGAHVCSPFQHQHGWTAHITQRAVAEAQRQLLFMFDWTKVSLINAAGLNSHLPSTGINLL